MNVGTVNDLIAKVETITHGFLPISSMAADFADHHTVAECRTIAGKLYASNVHQARCLGTFILGFIAARSITALKFLKDKVSGDSDWRVQEILAKAFDHYCSDIGYENALPVIEGWLSDKNSNVRRAVTEGLRVWTGREYFRDHPDIAIKYLSRLKDDDSEYVRRSVGNALRDISKKHAGRIRLEIGSWDISNKRMLQTYKLAGKFINSETVRIADGCVSPKIRNPTKLKN
jgi:hypothetical protein